MREWDEKQRMTGADASAMQGDAIPSDSAHCNLPHRDLKRRQMSISEVLARRWLGREERLRRKGGVRSSEPGQSGRLGPARSS